MSRLALLHGFTQTGRSWAPLLPALQEHVGEHGQVLTPDLPGHGSCSDVGVDLWEAARLVADECGHAAYLGYSMGGRVALHLGLVRPEVVERLVLVSATGGIDDTAERAARRREDEALARSLEEEGVDAFLERWLTNPLFAGLSVEAAGLGARRENTAAGLASALRLMGTGSQEALWHRLDELTMPVLVVAGDRDDKFAEQALHLGGWIGPTAQLALVPDAGHACHLENPDAFLELVLPFLKDDHGHGH
jgi:2-succinyl-6-hydroxy-2,4-cyclohexadiene-1-carboxylate synthase